MHQTTFSRAENFWYNWLKVAAILVTLFGVLLIFFNQAKGFDFLNKEIAEIFFLGPEMAINMAALQWWMVSIIGATTAG